VTRAKYHGKETVPERLPQPKPYDVGMQIACGVSPAVPPPGRVWTTADAPGRDLPGAGPPQREPERRRAFAARSRPSGTLDAAQVGRGAGGGGAHREERHAHCADIGGAAAQLCGRALLGTGVLCLDGGAGRGGEPAVHSGAGGGGPRGGAVGAVEVAAILGGSGFDRPGHLGWLRS
jgi:hypothetical protein